VGVCWWFRRARALVWVSVVVGVWCVLWGGRVCDGVR
jgi:hypothetical protein